MRQVGSKLIRVLLAVTLVVGLMPSTAWAAQPSAQVEDVSPTAAVQQPTDQADNPSAAAEAGTAEATDPSKTAESVTPSDDKALAGKDAADAVVAEKETTKEESAPKVLSAQTSWSNPLYNDDVVTGYVGPSVAYDYHGDVPYFGYDVYGEGYRYLHDALVNRQSTITLEVLFEESITTEDQMGQKAHDFFDAMKEEIKDDYLEFNLAGWDANILGEIFSDYAWLTLTYNVRYNTTLEQEQYVTSRINELYYEIDPYSYDSDYGRVKAIHDWICQNVHYDHANLNDSSYRLKYSAYAALHDGYAVCQGYALLFYRMCKEWGLDARIISGIGNGGAHGWNIVKVDDYYYNVDPTWDENYTASLGSIRYDFFLKSDDDFGDHQRDEKYWTQEYEVAPYSYGEWPKEPQIEATEISLNKEVPVQLQRDPYGEFKVGEISFTAPYTGRFDFVAKGEIYNVLNVETGSYFNQSWQGDNVVFNNYMNAGETVTISFEIDSYRDEILFGVYDAYDMGNNPTYEYNVRMETVYEYDSAPILATVGNFRKCNSWGWDYLYSGSEYTKSYLNADGSELTDTAFNAGDYILRITGIGDYFGSIDIPFTVYPLNDLRAYQIYVEESPVIRDGQLMWDPQVNVYSRYDEANDEYINLEYGEDYYIAGYEDAQGNRLSSFNRDVETYIVIAAYPGGKVSGEQRLRVWLNDADYLDSWSMTLSPNSYRTNRTYIGGSADDVKVYLGGGHGDQRVNLVEGVDYTVSWYEQFSEDELPGVPTESGEYTVRVTGIGNYAGSTMQNDYVNLTYTSATDVQLDQMTEFSMQSGDDDRYFIFTAPEAGTYRFRFETADLNQWGGSPISLGEYAYGPDFDSWSWPNGSSSTTRRDGDKVVQSGTSGEFELSEGQQVCISTEIHLEEGQATAYIKAIRSNDLDSDAFNIHSGRDNVALSEIESVLNSAYVETHDENWNRYQLQRGVDFQLSWKTLDGEAITVPQEEGEYYIVVTGINQYCGERLVRIAVTDPYNLDYYSMRPQGLMYDSQIGYVLWRPMATNVRVSLDGLRWLSQDRDFTLETIDNGDSVTVVARGISPYYGTKELTVPVVDKVSMSQASQYFSWRINHTYLSLNPYSLQSVPYTGAYIPMNIGPMPYGELGQADSRYVPIRDVDFQVRCYRVVDGEEIPVIAPK